MKKLFLFVLLTLVLTMFISISSTRQEVIDAGSKFEGNIDVGKSSVRIGEGAKIRGNIFIEEGDLFLASHGVVIGSITIKKGNVFIKDSATISKGINIYIMAISQ